MRASVVVASSVNASFNATSRNIYIDGREPESYPFPTTIMGGIRPVEAGKPQSREEFIRLTSKVAGRRTLTGQVPFPRSPSRRSLTSENASLSTGSGDGSSLRRSTNAAGSTADVVPPQEGVFTRCLTFLRRVGVRLVMPPYTVDDGMDNTLARRRGYVDSNATVTKLPLPQTPAYLQAPH